MSLIPNSNLNYRIFGETLPLPLNESTKTKELILVESTILFAKRGYDAVSIRDIAAQIGIKPSSLYNHFSGKEALFDSVLKHAEDLYLLYFQRLDQAMSMATSFSELLDLIFLEPRKMTNLFTCFAFALVQTEQFRDKRSNLILNNTFLDYSINFFVNWFDKYIARDMCPSFDTKTVATIIMHSVLMCINQTVHEHLKHHKSINVSEFFDNLKTLIMTMVNIEE